MSATSPALSTGPLERLLPRTSVGTKVVVAVTGLALVGFVIAHMLGNLQIYLGPEALNRYAAFLKSVPELLWTARVGLLLLFVTHVVLAVRLKLRTQKARSSPYVYEQLQATTRAGRYMLQTGFLVLAFVLFHLAHFTLGVVHTVPVADAGTSQVVQTRLLDLHDAEGRHDVYSMVVRSFQQPVVALLYIIAQALLAMHLYHGATSMFQTLGISNQRIQPLLNRAGLALALLIGIGNISIPVAVLAGLLRLSNGG